MVSAAKPLGRQSETGPCAGGGFEEQIGDNGAAEHPQFGFALLREPFEHCRLVQDHCDLFGREIFQAEQVAFCPALFD